MAGEWRERSLGELTENFDSICIPVREAFNRVAFRDRIRVCWRACHSDVRRSVESAN